MREKSKKRKDIEINDEIRNKEYIKNRILEDAK